MILSFFVHKRVSKYRLPTQLIFIVSLTFVMILERPSYPIARIWLWIYPLLALWCAAGFVGSLQWLEERFSIRRLTSLVLAITLGGFLVFGMRQAYIMLVQKVGVEDPVAEQVTQFLKPRLTADDLVLVSRCSDARYWYYFHHYGIPDVIGNRNRFFTKMYIIAYIQANPSCGNEDVKNVFSIYGPDSVFFDLKTLHIVKQFDYAAIYEMDPILQRIQKAYPNH